MTTSEKSSRPIIRISYRMLVALPDHERVTAIGATLLDGGIDFNAPMDIWRDDDLGCYCYQNTHPVESTINAKPKRKLL